MKPNIKRIQKLVDRLRETDTPQGFMALRNKHTGAHCAVGIGLYEVVPSWYRNINLSLTYNTFETYFGIDPTEVWQMNDAQETFPEIADRLEKRYLKNV